jgi:hypothetical protein
LATKVAAVPDRWRGESIVSSAAATYDGTAILGQCREAVRTRLGAQFPSLLTALAEKLQKDAQGNREEREQLADAGRRLRDGHVAFAEVFQKELIDRIDSSTRALQSGRVRNGEDEDLSTLKTNLLENQVAVSKLAVHLKRAAGAELAQFSGRVAAVFGRAMLDDGDNPIGPMAIAYAAYAGVDALNLNSHAARALRPDLEKRLVAPVIDLYKVMNGALERAGIAPATARGASAQGPGGVSAANAQPGVEPPAAAQAAAAQAVAAMLGVARVPALVAAFLQDTWSQVLAKAYGHGTDSAPWRGAIDTMNGLIASVKPGIDPAERARLKSVLPGLLKQIQAGMDAVALDAGTRKAVLDMLMVHHREILIGPRVGQGA